MSKLDDLLDEFHAILCCLDDENIDVVKLMTAATADIKENGLQNPDSPTPRIYPGNVIMVDFRPDTPPEE